MNRLQRGFTLMEVLVALAIIGILSAVALPMYADYIIRARLTEAFSGLASVPPQAEQYWSNNRTFADFDRLPANTENFTYTLSGDTESSYTVTATGAGKVAGFVYTIDQSGGRATTAAPEGWTLNAACWVDRKDGSCTQ
jgi:type IV pilus assembly protein PilE